MDTEVFTWMYDIAIFLWLGDHSMRLVHAVEPFVERYFPLPMVGLPEDIALARQFADELESLHVFHGKALEHDLGTDSFSFASAMQLAKKPLATFVATKDAQVSTAHARLSIINFSGKFLLRLVIRETSSKDKRASPSKERAHATK